MNRILNACSFHLCVSFIFVFLPLTIQSAVPPTINYQGYLTDSSGAPINATVNVTFRVYNVDTGGTDLWNEIDSVVISDGKFTTQLGDGTAFPAGLFDGTPLYLGIEVETDGEMNPRKPLDTTPFAFKAQDADTLGGMSGAMFLGNSGAQTLAGSLTLQDEIIVEGVNILPGTGGITFEDGSSQGTNAINSILAADGSGSTLDADLLDGMHASEIITAATEPTPPVCMGAYRALQFDGTNYVCVDISASGLSGGMANGFEAVDSWGDAWDGLARSVKNWSQADATCQSAGGRLPTATELYRVNGTSGTGEVGDAGQTDYLWTLIARDNASRYYAFRVSDGAHTNYNSSDLRAYRCIWPSNTASSFAGNRCYGPAGNECFAVMAEGGRYNVDTFDRPPLNPSGATRECAFYGAHLPTENALTEVIQDGLPNGSGNNVWTSDHEGWNGTNFLLGLVRWTGVNTTFADAYSADSTWGYNRSGDENAFRCAGLNRPFVPHTGTVTNAWSDPNLMLTSTTGDSATTDSFLNAIDSCRTAGGHLPYQRDMNELIVAGLPGGTDNYLWTADVQGGDAAAPNTGVVKWTGIDTGFTDYYSFYVTWGVRTTGNYAHRCVFYPTDGSYTGPGSCNGTCFNESINNGVATINWIDDTDRAPATYGDAARTCYAAGGHLPTHRDMAELIRAGVPNGSDTYLWTSDHIRYDLNAVVKWTDVDTAWGDVDGTDSSVSTRALTTTRPYRCVWSNELKW